MARDGDKPCTAKALAANKKPRHHRDSGVR
jgi:hypothetical protein